MSDLPPAPPSDTPPVAPLLVIGGILFIIIWAAACLLLMSLSLFGALMANDSGAASNDQHGGFLIGLFLSQIVITAAGLPAGLAFFWRRRRLMLLAFFLGGLSLGGIGLFASVTNLLTSADFSSSSSSIDDDD
jgi:hypothetical protein